MGVDYKIADVKCIHTNHIHISAMLNTDQQRGIKRKLEEDEKHDENLTGYNYIMQRQSIFNISILKLNKNQHTANASLLHSVLICNTLRTLEKELEQEGVKITYDSNQFSTFNNPVSELSISFSNVSEISSCSSLSVQSVASIDTDNSSVTDDESCDMNVEYNKYLHDLDSSGRLTPFVRTTQDNTGALGYDENDRLPSLNWSSVLNVSSFENNPNASGMSNYIENENSYSANSSTQNQVPADCSPSLHTLMPPASVSHTASNNVLPSIMLNFSTPSTVPSASPSNLSMPVGGYLSTSSNSGDEIFSDVDLSLYDFDLSSPNLRTAPITDDELCNSYENTSLQSSNFYRQEDCDQLTYVQS